MRLHTSRFSTIFQATALDHDDRFFQGRRLREGADGAEQVDQEVEM